MSQPKEDKEKMDVWGYLADSACYISRTLGLKDADDSEEDLPSYRSPRRQEGMRKGTVPPEEQRNPGSCPLQMVEGPVTEDMTTAAVLAAEKWRQAAEMSLDSLWHKAEEDLDDLWRQMDELTRRYKRLGREARKQTLRADNMSEALGMLLPRVEWLLSFMEDEQNRNSLELKSSDAEEVEIVPQESEVEHLAQESIELQSLGGRWEGEESLKDIPRVDKRLKLHATDEIEAIASSEPPFTSISTESSAATFATNTVPSTTTLGSERVYTSVATTTTADTTIKDSAATSWDHFQQPCPLASHAMKQKPLMVLKPAQKARTKSATDGKPKRIKKSHPRLARQHSTKLSHRALFGKDSTGSRISPKLHQQPSATASFPKPVRRKSRLFGQKKERYSSAGSIEVLCDSNQNFIDAACTHNPRGHRIKADSRNTSAHSTNITQAPHKRIRSPSDLNGRIVDLKPPSLYGIKVKSDSRHKIDQHSFKNRMRSDTKQRVNLNVGLKLPDDHGLKHDILNTTQNGNQLNIDENTLEAIRAPSLGDTVLRNVKYVSSSSLAVKKSALKQECSRNTSKKSVQFVKDVDIEYSKANGQDCEISLKTTLVDKPQSGYQIELICNQMNSQISSQFDPENCKICRRVSSNNAEGSSAVEIIKEVHTFRNGNTTSHSSSQKMFESIHQMNDDLEDDSDNIQILRLETNKNIDRIENYDIDSILDDTKITETKSESEQISKALDALMHTQVADTSLSYPDECFSQNIDHPSSNKNVPRTQNEVDQRNISRTSSINDIKVQDTNAKCVPSNHKTPNSSQQQNSVQNHFRKDTINFPLYPYSRPADICTICSNECFEKDNRLETGKECVSKALVQFYREVESKQIPQNYESMESAQPNKELITLSEVKETTKSTDESSFKNNNSPVKTDERGNFKQLRSEMNLSKSDTYCPESDSVVTFRSHTAITLHPYETRDSDNDNGLHNNKRNEWQDIKQEQEQSNVSPRAIRIVPNYPTDQCEYLDSRSRKSLTLPFDNYRNEKCPNARAKLYSNNLRKKVGAFSSISKKNPRRLSPVYQITTHLDSEAVSNKFSGSSGITSDVSLEYCKINLNGKKINNIHKSHRKSISQSVDISVGAVCCSKKPNPKPTLIGPSSGVEKVDILISINENIPARTNTPKATSTWTNFSNSSPSGSGVLSSDSQISECIKHECPRVHFPRKRFEPSQTEHFSDNTPPPDNISLIIARPCLPRIEPLNADLLVSNFQNSNNLMSNDPLNPELLETSYPMANGAMCNVPVNTELFHCDYPKAIVPMSYNTVITELPKINYPDSNVPMLNNHVNTALLRSNFRNSNVANHLAIQKTDVSMPGFDSANPEPSDIDTMKSVPLKITQEGVDSSEPISKLPAISNPISGMYDSLWGNSIVSKGSPRSSSPTASVLKPDTFRLDSLDADFPPPCMSPEYSIRDSKRIDVLKSDSYLTDFIRSKSSKSHYPITDYFRLRSIRLKASETGFLQLDSIKNNSMNVNPDVLHTPATSSPDPVSAFPQSSIPEIQKKESPKPQSFQEELFSKPLTPEITTTDALISEITTTDEPISEITTTDAPISEITTTESPISEIPLPDVLKPEIPRSTTPRNESCKKDIISTEDPTSNTLKHDFPKADSSTSTSRRKSPKVLFSKTESRKSYSSPISSIRSKSPRPSTMRHSSPNADYAKLDSVTSDSPKSTPSRSSATRPDFTMPISIRSRSPDSTTTKSGTHNHNFSFQTSPKSISPSNVPADPEKSISLKHVTTIESNIISDSTKINLRKSDSARSLSTKPDLSMFDSSKCKPQKTTLKRLDSINTDSKNTDIQRPNSSRQDSSSVDFPKSKSPRSCFVKPDLTTIDSTKPESPMIDSPKPKFPRHGGSRIDSKCLRVESTKPDTTRLDSVKNDPSCKESVKVKYPRGTLTKHDLISSDPLKPDVPNNDTKPTFVKSDTVKTKSPIAAIRRSGLTKPKFPKPTSAKRDSPKSEFSKLDSPKPGVLRTNSPHPISLRSNSPKTGPPRPNVQKHKASPLDLPGSNSPQSDAVKSDSLKVNSPQAVSTGPDSTNLTTSNLVGGKPEISRQKIPKPGTMKGDLTGINSPKLRTTKTDPTKLSSSTPTSPKRGSPRSSSKPGASRLESLRPGFHRPTSPNRVSPKPKVFSPISSRSGSPKHNASNPISPKLHPVVDHPTEGNIGKSDENVNTKLNRSKSPQVSMKSTLSTPVTVNIKNSGPSNTSQNTNFKYQNEEKRECAADKLESLEMLLDSLLCSEHNKGMEPLRQFEKAARHVVDKVARGEIEKDAILKVQSVLGDLLETNTSSMKKEDASSPECTARCEVEKRLTGHRPCSPPSSPPPGGITSPSGKSEQALQPNSPAVSPPTLSPYISTRAILRSTAKVSVGGGGRVSPTISSSVQRDGECILGATKQEGNDSSPRLDPLFIRGASPSSSSQDSNVSVTSHAGNDTNAKGNS